MQSNCDLELIVVAVDSDSLESRQPQTNPTKTFPAAQTSGTVHDLTSTIEEEPTTEDRSSGTDTRATIRGGYTCPVCDEEGFAKAEFRTHVISGCTKYETEPSLKTSQLSALATHPVDADNVFSEEGDLLLSVGDDGDGSGTNFLVHSKVLCAASPLFSKMFSYSSPFSEGQRLKLWRYGIDDPVVVEFDDEPDVFRILLLILFHRNSQLRLRLKTVDFARLAVIVDKYELHSAVKMWARVWKKSIKPPKDRVEKFCRKAPWLLMIGWVFGYTDIFEDATNFICRNFVIEGDSLVWHDDENEESVSLMNETPDIVIERMAKLVQTLKEEIKDSIRQEQTTRLLDIGRCCKVRTSMFTRNSNRVCDYFQLGLIHEYREREAGGMLCPGKDEHAGGLSLQAICSNLLSDAIPTLDTPAPPPAGSSTDHADCYWLKPVHERFKDRVESIGLKLSDFPSRKVV
ncbi:hypothetical protein BJ508DRAFT_379592 [Ascobolus immersus RN42]|uniref:BTB domain-containing protein n=1 Tax=Ascobolus immersus RN42 TaxID=1160509 RepID=A0A3N4HSB9_ASCIM|nr:hypothetical protein BJ508DRAFT_379592 [Ascobolus immersus RN42]